MIESDLKKASAANAAVVSEENVSVSEGTTQLPATDSNAVAEVNPTLGTEDALWEVVVPVPVQSNAAAEISGSETALKLDVQEDSPLLDSQVVEREEFVAEVAVAAEDNTIPKTSIESISPIPQSAVISPAVVGVAASAPAVSLSESKAVKDSPPAKGFSSTAVTDISKKSKWSLFPYLAVGAVSVAFVVLFQSRRSFK